MHYFIDGYNMLFRIPHAGGDLQIQREKIIHDLNQKIQILQLDVTIVFDAQHQSQEINRQKHPNLKILFTSRGQTADEFIIGEIQTTSTPKQETVVTSDKKLAWHARSKSAKTQSVEEFLQEINKRYKNRLVKIKNKKMIIREDLKSTTHNLPTLKTISSTITKKHSPSKIRPAEDFFEFYLEKFESLFQDITKELEGSDIKKKHKITNTKKKNKINKAVSRPDQLSDLERWKEVFEKGVRPTDEEEWE
jgi:uncharacterized protein